jgi:hypothetical protein
MTNALFNDNRLKLGVFGLNVSNGCAATTAEGHLQPTWQNNLDIAVMADGHSSSCSPPLSSRCLRCLISLYEFRTTRGSRSDGDNKPTPRQKWFYNVSCTYPEKGAEDTDCYISNAEGSEEVGDDDRGADN